MSTQTLSNILFLIIGIIAILLMIKFWKTILLFIRKYVVRILLILPIYSWLHYILASLLVISTMLLLKKAIHNELLEVILHFVSQYVLPLLIILSIFLIFEFRQVYFQSYKLLHSQHFVLRRFYISLLNFTITKESEISLPFGIKQIIRKLKTSEVVQISHEYFPEFLSASTQLIPSELYSVWNTDWYPINEIILLNDGSYEINYSWKKYFDALDKVYRNTSKKDNRRFFIIPDDFDFVNLSSEWKILIEKNKSWNVNLFFITQANFTKLSRRINKERCRQWKDLVLFRTNICGLYIRWVVAETHHIKNNINNFSCIDFSDDKEETKVTEEFFNELKDSNDVYKLTFIDNQIKISKENHKDIVVDL